MDGEEGGRTSPAPGSGVEAGCYVAFAAPSPDPPAPNLPPPPPLPSPPSPESEDIHGSRSWRREEGAEEDAIEILDCGGEERTPKEATTVEADGNASGDKGVNDEVDSAPRANGLTKISQTHEPDSKDGCGTECLFCAVSCCDYCVIM